MCITLTFSRSRIFTQMNKLLLIAGYFRALIFMLALIIAGFLITAFMIIFYPLLKIFDKKWQIGHHLCAGSQKLIPRLMMKAEVQGLENIPKDFSNIVIVSNHQSTLDMAVFAYLWYLPFYVTFKQELLYYPGMGTAMYLAGYLPVNRKHKDSGKQLIERCVDTLQSGKSVLFFPEGTRKTNTPLGPFKPGAFVAAHRAKSTIMPVTISGARKIFPTRGLPWFGFGSPVLKVHPPIACGDKSVDQLMEETRRVIESGLAPIDYEGFDAPTPSPEVENKKDQ